jgi:integrase
MIRRVLSKTFDCAVAWGYVDANPVAGTKAPTKIVRRSTRLAVDEADGGKDVVGQIGDFIAQLDTSRTQAETRAAILLCLLLGLRVKEATSLQLKYIDLKSGRVSIQGKAAKERALPLLGLAARLIEQQIAALGDLKTPWLFPQRHNPAQHITESSVTHAVGRAASAAGMDQLTTHDLRRTCATGMRELGTDWDVISQILGHRQHDVTATYVRAELWPKKQQALERWAST